MKNFTNAETAFNNNLSELYGAVDIKGYQFEVGPALYELDPTAYREAFLEWLDAKVKSIQEHYPGLNQELADIEDFFEEEGKFDIFAYGAAIDEASRDE